MHNKLNYQKNKNAEELIKIQSYGNGYLCNLVKTRIKPNNEYSEQAAEFFHSFLTTFRVSLRKVQPICEMVLKAFVGISLSDLGIKLDRTTIQRLHLGAKSVQM